MLPTPLGQKSPKHGLHLVPVSSHSILMLSSELSSTSSKAFGTENKMNSFPERQFLAGSYVGQNASIGKSCNNLQATQKNWRSFLQKSCCPPSGCSWAGSASTTTSSPQVGRVCWICEITTLLLNLLPSGSPSEIRPGAVPPSP